MWKCKSCGTENQENSNFCYMCGAVKEPDSVVNGVEKTQTSSRKKKSVGIIVLISALIFVLLAALGLGTYFLWNSGMLNLNNHQQTESENILPEGQNEEAETLDSDSSSEKDAFTRENILSDLRDISRDSSAQEIQGEINELSIKVPSVWDRTVYGHYENCTPQELTYLLYAEEPEQIGAADCIFGLYIIETSCDSGQSRGEYFGKILLTNKLQYAVYIDFSTEQNATKNDQELFKNYLRVNVLNTLKLGKYTSVTFSYDEIATEYSALIADAEESVLTEIHTDPDDFGNTGIVMIPESWTDSEKYEVNFQFDDKDLVLEIYDQVNKVKLIRIIMDGDSYFEDRYAYFGTIACMDGKIREVYYKIGGGMDFPDITFEESDLLTAYLRNNIIPTMNWQPAPEDEPEEMYEEYYQEDTDFPSDYIISYSNTRYLTEEDLDGLSHPALGIARNEILARHGRIFTKHVYADYFSRQSWYIPTTEAADFDVNLLNDYEFENLKFIKNYEDKYWGGPYY